MNATTRIAPSKIPALVRNCDCVREGSLSEMARVLRSDLIGRWSISQNFVNELSIQEPSQINFPMLQCLEIPTRNVSEGFCTSPSIPRSRFLKLRSSRWPWINGPKTQGIITTRRVSEGFSRTLHQTQKHNPSLTQRVGMAANAQLQNSRFGLG
jgi:hypothetical protein